MTGAAAQNINTVAGGGSPLGLAATAWGASGPGGAAVDASGNVYLAVGNQIWIVNAAGVVTGLVGTGTGGYSGDGGPASSATLNLPTGVALDAAGNIYIADQQNNVVRKVTVGTGIITTFAGNGTYSFSGDGVPATDAQLAGPAGVAVDSSGNLYIADEGNRRIRKVTAATGFISTVAGDGGSGYNGDGELAIDATLNFPTGVAVDSSGNIYIADSSNNLIREVSAATGFISTIAGGGAGTGSGVPATSIHLDSPVGITLGSNGNLYIADSGNCLIRKFTVGGNINTVAGDGSCAYSGDGGAATSAALNSPTGVAVDSSGNLYIADYANNLVRKVTAATGKIGTFAGNGTPGLAGNGGEATSAELHFPTGVAVDSAGDIYIADTNNQVIRKVTAATGDITTFAGNGTTGYSGDGGPAISAQLYNPYAIAVDSGGNLYIADTGNAVIRKVTPAGVISTVAGNNTAGYSGDLGPAISAELRSPFGVAVDGSGNLYIADASNQVIRMVTAATGIITTIAGNGTNGYSGDGGPATSAHLSLPFGVAVDSNANVYISDSNNSVIRKVTAATGVITTIAGNGTAGYSGDGGPATGAELYYPYGISVDSGGNIYVADSSNSAIRKFTAGGNITTFAGTGTFGYSGDGGQASSAELASPEGVTVGAGGLVFVADSGNNRIRAITVPAGLATHFTVSAPAAATAGTAFNNLVVTALDANNDTVTGYGGTIHFTSTDGASALPANATLTNGAGTFSATLNTPGNQTITATDTVTVTITGVSGTIAVSGGPATHFTVTAPAAATAGTAFNNLVVTALDANNNTATAYAGTVHFSSTDGAAALPANATLINGTGTFSAILKTTGNRTITAADTISGSITGTTGTITVTAGPATHFTLTAPAAATAGTAFNNLVVTALDANNNTAAAYAGTVHFTSTDGAAALPANATLTNGTGTFSVTLNTIGNQTITATDTVTAGITGTSGLIAVNQPQPPAPAPPSYYPPNLTMSFGLTSMPLGGTTTLTFTLSNPNQTLSLSGVGFTDELPAGLIVTSPGSSASSCGPVTTTMESINLSAGTLGLNGTCSFSITVMGVAVGTQNDTTGPVASAQVSGSSSAFAQLNVTQGTESIMSSGSFVQGAIAPNSILTYFGPVICLPNEQVLINGTATKILFANATQINFVSPGSLVGGAVTLQIVCTGYAPVTLTAPVATANPSIFTQNETGKGEGAILNLDETVNSPAAPTQQGSYISVYGTGFGAFAPSGPDGLQHLVATVTANIGGVAATVVYAGEAPGETSGLQQINIRVPTGIAAGPAVPILLSANGAATQNGVTLAVQ